MNQAFTVDQNNNLLILKYTRICISAYILTITKNMSTLITTHLKIVLFCNKLYQMLGDVSKANCHGMLDASSMNKLKNKQAFLDELFGRDRVELYTVIILKPSRDYSQPV